MKQISRKTADELFTVVKPLNASINQNEQTLCIIISLSNGQSLKVIHDRKNFQKKYFLNE